MPYEIRKSGNQYCVHKKDGGKKMGCHSSREKAKAQIAAIHANENKEKADGLLEQIKGFFSDLIGKEVVEQEESKSGFLVFKEKSGRLRYVVRYSNKFRDDDYPVKEIISENSHQRFAEMVDKGIAPMPEMWLWHVPEWKFGVADWHAYDDSGFAMASGLVDEGKEEVAIWLSKQKGVRTSHGMPPDSIIRDPDDPSVIVSHITVETSVLPEDRAANKMTGFLILGNESKETGMAIPEHKLQELRERWGADPELLDEIQRMNEADAAKAKAAGIESKEVGSEEEETKPEAEAVEETAAKVEEESQEPEEEQEAEPAEDANVEANKATGGSPTRDEIAEAVVEAIAPIVEQNRELANEVAQLRKEVTHLKGSDEEKIEKAISETSPASIGALIATRLSAINSKETEVDGRTSLAKSKPKEAEQETPNHFGVPFIDEMLFGSGKDQESQ